MRAFLLRKVEAIGSSLDLRQGSPGHNGVMLWHYLPVGLGPGIDPGLLFSCHGQLEGNGLRSIRTRFMETMRSQRRSILTPVNLLIKYPA